jgi:hypothetical protein
MTYVFALPVATLWMYENYGLSCFLSVAYRHAGLPQDLFPTMVPLRLAAMVELRCI